MIKRMLLVCLFLLVCVPLWATTEKSKDIVGYQDYTLGGTMPADTSEWVRSTDESLMPDYYLMDYKKSDTFLVGGAPYSDTLSTYVYQGSIEAVIIDFDSLLTDCSSDLDGKVASMVFNLERMYESKYDASLIKYNQFTWGYSSDTDCWNGLLRMKDSDGDIIIIVWNAYFLRVYYMTDELWTAMNKTSSVNQQKQNAAI